MAMALAASDGQKKFAWATVIAFGVMSFGVVALKRGEPINAAWLVIAAVCIYAIAYRFYARFVADKVLGGIRPASRRPTGTMTGSIMCRPTATCSSATISPR